MADSLLNPLIMSRTPKRITSQEASQILGITGEAVRRLGNDGIISYVDVISPEGKTTRYYFRNEVLARKNACTEYTKIADDTQSKLKEAMRLNKEASVNEENARKQLRSSLNFKKNADRLIDILNACFVAVNGVHPLADREKAILSDIIHLRSFDETAKAYGVTTERLRQISFKAAYHLLKGKTIAEECVKLRQENERLREENRIIKDTNAIIKKNAVSLSDDEIFVLSEYDFKRRQTVLSDLDALNLDRDLKRNLLDRGITCVMDIVTSTRKELILKGIEVNTLGLYLRRKDLYFDMNLSKLGIGNKRKLERLLGEGQQDNMSDDDIKMRHLLLSKIPNQGLSVRAYSCLRAADIETFADLVQYDSEELMKMLRNFGRKSLAEIENMLEKMDLHFGIDPRDYGIVPNPKWHLR